MNAKRSLHELSDYGVMGLGNSHAAVQPAMAPREQSVLKGLAAVMFQLRSNPSDKEQREAQSQLSKSDEIQRLVTQAHDRYRGDDCEGATVLLDAVIEVKRRRNRPTRP